MPSTHKASYVTWLPGSNQVRLLVVANAVAALSEIAQSHPSSNLLNLNPQSINKLLTALNECTEWGQIFILDCLANYIPKDDREAQRGDLRAEGRAQQ
uniref:AP-1 complex subunit beta-1-like n=1 Tax=Macaca mulatta TaxID=9544 RepID=UPI0010A1FB93|nr:AP-1 complex subunit beta-1-like [Macaca mulatta]